MSTTTLIEQQNLNGWVAAEMSSDRFSPFDIELPDVPTVQFHGTIKLGSLPVEYSFITQEEHIYKPAQIFTFFQGFGGIKVSSLPFGSAMARLNMGTLMIEPIRKDDRSYCERVFDPHAIQIEAMDAALEDLKFETGIALSSAASGTKAVTIGHSMGGEPALRFAEAHKDTTDAAILIATIGFGSPNIYSIFKKFIHVKSVKNAITEEITPFLRIPEVPKDINALSKALGYFVINPARTIGEIGSCLTSDQRERSQTLHNAGIPVIYGQPYYDMLVQGLDGARTSVSTVSEIDRAGHMIVQAKPGRAAHWVLSALGTIEFA